MCQQHKHTVSGELKQLMLHYSDNRWVNLGTFRNISEHSNIFSGTKQNVIYSRHEFPHSFDCVRRYLFVNPHVQIIDTFYHTIDDTVHKQVASRRGRYNRSKLARARPLALAHVINERFLDFSIKYFVQQHCELYRLVLDHDTLASLVCLCFGVSESNHFSTSFVNIC